MSTTISLDLQMTFNHRLRTLCDGRSGLRGGFQIEVREPAVPPASAGNPPPVLDFIASNETLDRYDEILLAAGWRLDNYRRNPVFQNAHQYGDVIFTLGKALITEVRDGSGSGSTKPCLFQRIEFAVEANPMARIAYGLYKGGFLRAVSVGFIPIRWENGGPESAFRRKYLEQELLEVSAVGIPANPDALQLGLRSGAVHKADLLDLIDLLHQITKARPSANENDSHPFPAVPGTHAGASGARNNEAQLLQLARALRDILRRN